MAIIHAQYKTWVHSKHSVSGGGGGGGSIRYKF